jgi:hypothetical protein
MTFMAIFPSDIFLIIIALISIGIGLHGVITARTFGFGYKYTGRAARIRGTLAILGGTALLLTEVYIFITRNLWIDYSAASAAWGGFCDLSTAACA